MSYASEFQNGIYGATYPGMMSMMTLDGYNPNPMNGADFDIIKFNIIEPTPDPVITIPTTLVNINPIPEDSAVITRNLIFTPQVMGPNQLNGNFLINGVSFNLDVIKRYLWRRFNGSISRSSTFCNSWWNSKRHSRSCYWRIIRRFYQRTL